MATPYQAGEGLTQLRNVPGTPTLNANFKTADSCRPPVFMGIAFSFHQKIASPMAHGQQPDLHRAA